MYAIKRSFWSNTLLLPQDAVRVGKRENIKVTIPFKFNKALRWQQRLHLKNLGIVCQLLVKQKCLNPEKNHP
jgi:hypothetical protein